MKILKKVNSNETPFTHALGENAPQIPSLPIAITIVTEFSWSSLSN